MNLLKKSWNWLVRKTSTAPTPVEVEECNPFERTEAGTIFYDICRSVGMRNKIIVKHEIVEKFQDWYNGSADRGEIENSTRAFAEAHPEIASYTRPLT